MNIKLPLLLLCSLLLLYPVRFYGQGCDTLSNWENITQSWYVSTGVSEVVENPQPEDENTSAHCFRVVTDAGMYNYMICDLPEPVNFDAYPRYRLKVLAPPSGGDVTLKFENYNNTASHELVMTPVPGHWTDLEYNFSGFDYPDLTRMVIFYDFQGVTPGISWYIDDVIREIPPPLTLESNLPLVVINTFGVSIPDEPKIPGHMGIIDNGPGQINNLSDPYNGYNGAIGIEIRGQSSQMFPKKSYAVETRDNAGENLDVPLLGMPAENDWVLYAPYSDKSMLRNVVTFIMGRRMGEYCTRTRYCEVVINGDYKGVYVLMEKIKKDGNRVDIATLKPDEISGDDLTGGYIVKVDKIDPGFQYGTDGWLSEPDPSYPNAMNITFQYYYPDAEDIVSQQRDYIRNYISDAEDALIATGFMNRETGYYPYMDARSFVDFMLLSEIPKEVDKYRYSTFFYKQKESDGGKLFAGPAWDFNLGYGNVDYWSPGVTYTGWLYTMTEPYDWSIMYWWKRLMEDPWFRDLAKTRWIYLRQDLLSDEALHLVNDSLVQLISQAQERNYARWPILGQYVWPNYNWYGNSYADEVVYFENYLFNRLSWMDSNLAGDELRPWIGISAESGRIILNLFGDYLRSPVLRPEDFRLNNAPAGLYIQGVQYISPSACALLLSSDVSGNNSLSVTLLTQALNTPHDLTSNPLGSAGIAPDTGLSGLKVFVSDNAIRIQNDRQGVVPEYADLTDLSGKLLGSCRLSPNPENSIPRPPLPGIYLLRVRTGRISAVYKIAVID